MLNGFHKETADLTEQEIRLAHDIASKLRFHIGVEEAVSSNEMIADMKTHGVAVSSPRLRKMINYIRLKRLVKNLIATSDGYYVENDPVRIKTYVESLRSRAEAILEVARSFEDHNTQQTSLFPEVTTVDRE